MSCSFIQSSLPIVVTCITIRTEIIKDQFKNWLYKKNIFNESKAFSQRYFDDKYHLQQIL